MEKSIVTQSRLLIKQWSFGFIESSPLTRSMKNSFGFAHASSFPLHWGQLYFIGRLWQLLTASNVGARTQAWQAKWAVFKIPGFVCKRLLPFFPTPHRSLTCAIFRAVFDSRSSFFAVFIFYHALDGFWRENRGSLTLYTGYKGGGGGGVQKLTPPNPRASGKTQKTFLNQNLTPKLSKAEFPSHKWISRTQRQSQNKFGFTSFAELLAP